ncbi:MAG TPA: class I SAM-dependent methyltransferase [Ferrovibrio sp.]|uniref:class I SAM-dependent methyltransferase n=1 Tax=Ferrovibrio sp. TaxID=1917215 RepID=UPI002ED64B94
MSEAAANPAAGANAAQVEDWNGETGQRWLRQHERLNPQIAPIGQAAMDRAALAAGERVLDVGCGCGETSLELAQRVGPGGAVIGIDASRMLLDAAKALMRRTGTANASFLLGDAQSYAFSPASFDLIFSRFGVMFFADPVAAFRNLLGALRSGGRLSFACWRAPQESEYVAIPMQAALRHVPRPDAADPPAPGPFAFADADYVRAILSEAGFAAIEIAPFDHKVGGGTREETAAMLLEMGPASRLFRGQDAAVKAAIRAELDALLAPLETPEGVRLGIATWLVRATKV